MNISFNWLKELIDIDASAEEVAKSLTSVGLAVEAIEPHGGDYVLDVDLTSNRPDCLSHLGVARELSVAMERPLKPFDALPITSTSHSSDLVTIEAQALCHRFTARIVRGVKVGPSPQWLVDRLEAIGERSINNVADVTNYVMHELGQPMHAFDFDTLDGHRIIVRQANAGEAITTLDEVDRELDETSLAICDASRPVAIAGIIGGLHTSITNATTNVLLEVAYFAPASIRSTARRQNIRTEASHRFERGVDIENLIRASERAANLIVELAGGEKSDFVDIFPAPPEPRFVESPDISSAVHRLTGLDVSTDECLRILAGLGISTDGGPTFQVPTWRHDIAIEEDLVEEVARHFGYDKIVSALPPAYSAGEYQPTERRERQLRSALVDLGFGEGMTYSFIDLASDDKFEPVPGVVEKHVEYPFVMIRDAVIEGSTLMRPSNLAGLLDAVRTNLNHQRRDLKLFEIGRVFGSTGDAEQTPNEVAVLSIVITGSERSAGRELPGRALDFHDITGAVSAAAESLRVDSLRFEAGDVRHLQPGQAACVLCSGETIGYAGRLRDELAAQYKFKSPVFCAELNLDSLLAASSRDIRYQPLPRFPSITRDVSLVVPRSAEYARVREAALDHSPEILAQVDFVDEFEGASFGEGLRSLTLRFTYRHPERTLSDAEVEVAHEEIAAKLRKFAE
jgi:phenylalanyl-tRNA synthetase beta chain